MRSLQVRFGALVLVLLLAASAGVGWLALHEERVALEVAIRARAEAGARALARRAAPALAAGDRAALDALLDAVAREPGVVGASIRDATGATVAALDARDAQGERLAVAATVGPSGEPLGAAHVELDLGVLVEPTLARGIARVATAAALLATLGAAAGLFVGGRLAGPLRRLRAGVERLAAGDLGVRVPPTSSDEIGELTRAFNEMGESLQQKQRIQAAFGRYVSDYVVTQSLAEPGGVALGGAEREVTILFADVRRFTRLSEGLDARDVVALLNDVFQRASDCILRWGGTIDKFMGDSVMAYFGAPVAQPDHAQRAVAAAIDIQRAMAERRPPSGAPAVELGIGIHTGTVVVGNIGCDQRMDFTAVGDAVNVANRVEKLAAPRQVLISEAVQRRVRGAFRLQFEGERMLSGRREPVHVYAVEADGVGARGAGAGPPSAQSPPSAPLDPATPPEDAAA